MLALNLKLLESLNYDSYRLYVELFIKIVPSYYSYFKQYSGEIRLRNYSVKRNETMMI